LANRQKQKQKLQEQQSLTTTITTNYENTHITHTCRITL